MRNIPNIQVNIQKAPLNALYFNPFFLPGRESCRVFESSLAPTLNNRSHRTKSDVQDKGEKWQSSP